MGADGGRMGVGRNGRSMIIYSFGFSHFVASEDELEEVLG